MIRKISKFTVLAAAAAFLSLSPALAQVPSFDRPPFQPPTYSASFSALAVPQTGAGDAVCLVGSATKTITVTRVAFNGIKATVDKVVANLVKRTIANTGGTSSSATIASMDSNNAAATAVLKGYTVIPTPGAGINLRAAGVAFPAASASVPTVWDFNPAMNLAQPITLRGVAQSLCINFPAAFATDGPALDADFSWTEK